MKRIAILLTAAAIFAACTNEEKAIDPLETVMKEKVASMVGCPVGKVEFSLFERADSTTYGQELEHRKTVFTQRLSQNTKFYDEYKSSGMAKNARRKKVEIKNDERVLAGLDEIEKSIQYSLDIVAYYDCHFSGKATTNDGIVTEFKDYWACVTPKGEVMCVIPERKGLHKTMGRILPGYTELIRRNDGEEAE